MIDINKIKKMSLKDLKQSKYYKNLPNNINKSKKKKNELIKAIDKYFNTKTKVIVKKNDNDNLNIIIKKLRNDEYNERQIKTLMKKYHIPEKNQYHNIRSIVYQSLRLKKLNKK
jgi:hypothetical protein